VPDGVVVLQELALVAQGAVQVRGHGAGAERGLVALVLELDHNDVIDLPRGEGPPAPPWCATWLAAGIGRPEKQGSDREGSHRAEAQGTEGKGHAP
jgi:hypothetical protein